MLFGEAADLAGFVSTYVDPVQDGARSCDPGLTMANRRRAAFTFGPETATDLLSLHGQRAERGDELRAASDADGGRPTSAMPRARPGRTPGGHRDGARRRRRGRERQATGPARRDHKDPTGDDLLAAALADYAGMARQPAIYAELQELAGVRTASSSR
ncbi:MAG: hypothetical protein U1F43_18690 [Myxococcota bacterium]